MLFFNYNYIWSISYMWDRPLIFKELEQIYIVNHKRFWTKREAEIYIAERERIEIGRRLGDAEQGREI